MRNYLIISTLITSISLQSCKTMDASLTLNVSNGGLEVLQQIINGLQSKLVLSKFLLTTSPK